MNATDVIRWLTFEARRCRGKDNCEAFCLLLPPIQSALDLPPMDEAEAAAFRQHVKRVLRGDLKKEEA